MLAFFYLFAVFLLMAVLYKKPLLTAPILIFLTMIFERVFTLTPLVFGDFSLKIYPLDILLIFSFIIYLRRGYFNNIKFNYVEKLILLFIVVSFINLIRSLLNLNADFDIAVSTFKNYSFYALFYFFIIASFNVEKDKFLENIKKVFVVAGICLLPLFIYGLITGNSPFTEFTPLSTEGSRAIAPTYAFYILISLITVLAYPDLFRSFGNQSQQPLHFERFRPIIVWLFILAVSFSLSRHLWLAMAIGLYIIWRYMVDSRQEMSKTLKKPLIGIILIFIIATLFISFITPRLSFEMPDFVSDIFLRFKSFFAQEGDVSFDFRVALWKESLGQFLANLFFGIGFGQEITFPLTGNIMTVPIRELHNSLFAILLQMGIVGFLPVLLIVIWIFVKFFNLKDKEISAYALALIVIFLFSSLFGTYLEINLLALFFWVFLAIYKISNSQSDRF